MIVSFFKGLAKLAKGLEKSQKVVHGKQSHGELCSVCGQPVVAGNAYCQGCLADMDRDESRRPMSSEETEQS